MFQSTPLPTLLRLLPLTLLICFHAEGAVYRCVDEAGSVLYSQFSCRNAEVVTEKPVSVIQTPKLSESEQLTLRNIEQAALTLERTRRTRARQLHRRRAEHNANRKVLCQQALGGLSDIRARKRSGYSLSESSRLAGREAELRRQQAQNC